MNDSTQSGKSCEDIAHLEDKKTSLTLQTSLYSKEAVLAAAYKFLNDCHVSVSSPDESHYDVSFEAKDKTVSLASKVKDFLNELIDQQLRYELRTKIDPIKEIIIRKAFFPFEDRDGG